MRRLAAATTLVLVIAACTTEETSDPGPTLTTTSSTSTTTTVAPTTVAPTTTAPVETTAPETTLPAGPAEALVPLFVGGAESAGWLFLGAWQQDRWQESTDPSGSPIRPGIEAGTPFTVSNLSGETSVSAGENAEACLDGRVGPSFDVDVAPAEPPTSSYSYNAVAVLDQPWPLKPRPVAATSTAPDAYQALGEAAFVDQPVDASKGTIEHVVVTDLDGDGDDEALAAFEFIQPTDGPGEAGDFAAILLIDATTRAADTVTRWWIDQDAEDGDFDYIERYRVLDVADLNGDGRMEVLVHAWHFEGASVDVYTYDGSELTRVLSSGCLENLDRPGG
jgi:hypothetical protein